VIRNVVFDIGGVLLDWDPRAVYRQLVDDEAEIDRLLGEVLTMDWNLELDAGRSFDEACAELAARHPDDAELIEAWKRQDEMVVGEIADTGDIVRRLRLAGVPLYLLTNMPQDVFEARLATWSILQGFDGAIVSGGEKVVKPSPAIFELLTTRFDLVPAETLFVDDSVANVRGAEAAGFGIHHFTGAADLEVRLIELGLLDGSG
jgi:2-haloacid dehalogenase